MKTAEIVQINPDNDFNYLWKIKYTGRGGSKAVAMVKFAAIIGDGLQTTMKDPTTGGFMDVFWQATAEEIIRGYKAFLQFHIRESSQAGAAADYDQWVKTIPFWLNAGCWHDQDLELAGLWDQIQGHRYE